ncbi:ribosome biogenesis protein NOP53 [Mercurialis annua]|uniref:ribosome biogenesis protein NOP53 n=1 Tax=Mercurialis annua TaxID=3986 RepID=UPI00215DE6EE|nr:ribosome biogenesis protein NOP53 [Mercurialis annua]
MGKKPKSSRKGKKAWRANISTEDIDNFNEKSTKDALSGGSLTHVPTDSLFFVDKTKDLSVRRKIEKHREKVLRCDSVLQKNPFVQVVPSSHENKGRKKKIKKARVECEQKDGAEDSGMVDLWGNEGECDNKTRKVSNPSVIPAVEVEPPGCSYNPSFEAHQDSLAQAVAEEMQKVYKSELGPQPVPLTVPADQQVCEDDMYFLDADNGDDDEDNLIEDGDIEDRSIKTKRVTRVELNKRARLKAQKKKKTEAEKKKELSKEIDSLPAILKEIAKEDAEKDKRHLRRMVAKQERLKTRPPRLGKHKFVPAPSQVLLSEEITGSLRKLKGCCSLLRDRFKSIEKRGLIAPTPTIGRR